MYIISSFNQGSAVNIYFGSDAISMQCYYFARAPPHFDGWGGGGRRPLEVDSFHATLIGVMLKTEKVKGWGPSPS